MAWEAAPPPPTGAAALAPVPARSNGHTAAETTTDAAEPARPAGRRARRASNASPNGRAGRGESDDDGPPATTTQDEHLAAAPLARKAAPAAGRGRRGFTGTVIRVRVDGAGPKAHAVWSIRQPADCPQPTPGARIHVERPPGYGGLVRALRDDHDGAHIFEVEITAARPAPGTPEEHAIPATDPRWLGTEVSFAPGSATSARTPTRRRSPSPL
jgi:hypothetical protein